MNNLLFIKKDCIRCGHEFTANRMISNDDTCYTCNRMNSITFWYPRLKSLEFPMPKTIIINAECDLNSFVGGSIEVHMGQVRFFRELNRALDELGMPAFIKTEMLANKHDWKHSCFVASRLDLPAHIGNLLEQSAVATIDRMTDCDFFAVREMIPTTPLFTYFPGDMPITKEIRVFFNNNKVQCWHPYWPKEAFGKDVVPELIDELQSFTEAQIKTVEMMAKYVSNMFSGYWSMDLLLGSDGEFYMTDMAIGERSYHYPGCKFDKDNVKKI